MSSREPTDDGPTRRDVLDRIAEPIVGLDTSFTVTYADDRALSLLDADRTAALGTHIEDVLPGAASPAEDALTTGEPRVFRFEAPDGNCVAAHLSPGDDGVSILLTEATDDRRRSFQRIVENLPVAVGRTTAGHDGTFSYVNDALVEMFGAESVAAIKQRSVSEFYADPDDRTALADALTEAGRIEGREVRFQRLDGSEFYGAVTARLEDVDGQTHILKIIRDVTDRKEREAELQRKTRAIEEAPVGITISDPNKPDNPMVYVNQGFVDITGYDKAEALGRNCRFLQGQDTDPEPVAAMREAVENREQTAVELRNYRTDGTEFWNRVTIAPVEDDDGAVTHFVGFQEDITERKASESRLETQRDNLETLNQVLRHDIRNDLQLILSYGELLSDEVSGDSRDYLDTLLESAENAVALTRTARDMADVMLHRADDLEPVSVSHTLERTLDELRSARSDAVVRVDGQIPDVTVQANDMLDSVFRNLLSNAIQHNDRPVPEVTASVRTDDDSVVVAIADNGPGVPDDQKAAIFGKGEKGLESDGSGLGLYLVQTLVDIYDGEVWVEDNDPDGAVFTVRLPTTTSL